MDNAFERARAAYGTGAYDDATLEFLFPQLKESEDEKARKWLTNLVENLGDAADEDAEKELEIMRPLALAYLEKQKDHFCDDTKMVEQKPAEWSEEDNIGWEEAFACVTRTEKAAKNEEELQNAVTAEKWLKEIKFKYYVHPVKQEWSDEERHNVQRLFAQRLTGSNPSVLLGNPARNKWRL